MCCVLFMKKVLFLFSDRIIPSQSPVNGYYGSLYLDHADHGVPYYGVMKGKKVVYT